MGIQGQTIQKSACFLLWVLLLTRPAPVAADTAIFYKYKNVQGRTVYVNDPKRIPKKYRKEMQSIDLSHISLNRQLANELQAEIDQEYEQLKKTLTRHQAGMQRGTPCPESEEEAPSWFRLLWDRYGFLVLIAALLFFLLLITPSVTKRVDPGRWTRLLMFLLPLLGTIALMTYASVKTTMVLNELREERQQCRDDSSGPFKNIRELRETLKRIEQQRQKAYQGD